MGLAEQQEQQRAFDRLGPLAREALRNAPHDISAIALVKQFAGRTFYDGGKPRQFALSDPILDAHIAKYVADRIREKFKAEPAVFKIEPLGMARPGVYRAYRGRMRTAR